MVIVGLRDKKQIKAFTIFIKNTWESNEWNFV